MKKPKNENLYKAVFAEVQEKNQGALGYQVDEMTEKEYARRYSLVEDDSPFEENAFASELDAFFASKGIKPRN